MTFSLKQYIFWQDLLSAKMDGEFFSLKKERERLFLKRKKKWKKERSMYAHHLQRFASVEHNQPQCCVYPQFPLACVCPVIQRGSTWRGARSNGTKQSKIHLFLSSSLLLLWNITIVMWWVDNPVQFQYSQLDPNRGRSSLASFFTE